MPGLPTDMDLLMLAFPVCTTLVERLVVAHLGVFIAELLESRALLCPPVIAALAATFRVHFLALRPLS